MKNTDILCLEWILTGRDGEVFRLIKHRLRQLGYTVQTESAFNWRHSILKHKPKLLLINDPVGDNLNGYIAKCAKAINLPSICFANEGDFVESMSDFFIWGWNKDRILYQNLLLQWSERVKKITTSREPQLKNQLQVSGAIGFDRYKIYNFMSKAEFFKKYKLKFQKLVTYAGWGLDMFNPMDIRYQLNCDLYGIEQVKRFQQDTIELREIFKILAQKNPDTLFVLKLHPGTRRIENTEVHGLDKIENIMILTTEETIGDLINASDFWMAFESTTCMEAWLLNKQSLLINPSGSDFKRSNISMGSPIFRNASELNHAMIEFYNTGFLPGFKEKQPSRENIIKNTIQWSDGKNHLRACYIIDNFIKSTNSSPDFSKFNKTFAVLQNIIFHISPYIAFTEKLKSYKMYSQKYDSRSGYEQELKLKPLLDAFNKMNELTADEIKELEELNA